MAPLRTVVQSLNALAHFEAAARHMSFSRAAEELHVTQSAVSHAVKQLERSLGLDLFVRKPRSLELTAAGETLFRSVGTGLGLIGDTIALLKGRAADGELVVAGSTSMIHFWMLPRTNEFQALHPEVRLKLQTLDRDPDLASAGIDVFLRIGDGNWPEYDAVRLWPEEMYAVASPDYLRRREPIRAVDDLADHELIVYEDPFRRRPRWDEWLVRMGAHRPCPAAGRLSLTDYAVALHAAVDGAGITLSWRPSIDDLVASGRLALAWPEPLVTGRHFWSVTPKGAAKRPSTAAFCRWLQRMAAEAQPLGAGPGGTVAGSQAPA